MIGILMLVIVLIGTFTAKNQSEYKRFCEHIVNIREITVATGGVLINPSALIVKFKHVTIDQPPE